MASSCERQRTRRARLKAAGARELLVTLPAEALEALGQLRQKGQSTNQAVAAALIQCVAGLAERENPKALKNRLKAEARVKNAEAKAERAKAETLEMLAEVHREGIAIHETSQGEDGVFRKNDLMPGEEQRV